MMNAIPSSIILIGIGGAGAAMVRGVIASYGLGIRALAIDTDAQTGSGDLPFRLLGGNRLAGRGTGGQPALARAAFQDDPSVIDTALEGVRSAVIVTGLGGGTGGGATSELLKHLHTLGIATILFATQPFSFEGDDRVRAGKTAAGPIEQYADVSVFLPLDDLVAIAGADNMKSALQSAIETMSAGVTLLWRLLEHPGYIELGPERLRSIISGCGRGQFATITASGANRAETIISQIVTHPLLAHDDSRPPVRTVLLGVLAGDDLRLSEVGNLVSGIQTTFGANATIELGTVNDETTFAGRISVVVLIFEENATNVVQAPGSRRARSSDAIRGGEQTLGTNTHFRNTDKITWNDEDLDVPTYIRRNLTLDR